MVKTFSHLISVRSICNLLLLPRLPIRASCADLPGLGPALIWVAVDASQLAVPAPAAPRSLQFPPRSHSPLIKEANLVPKLDLLSGGPLLTMEKPHIAEFGANCVRLLRSQLPRSVQQLKEPRLRDRRNCGASRRHLNPKDDSSRI